MKKKSSESDFSPGSAPEPPKKRGPGRPRKKPGDPVTPLKNYGNRTILSAREQKAMAVSLRRESKMAVKEAVKELAKEAKAKGEKKPPVITPAPVNSPPVLRGNYQMVGAKILGHIEQMVDWPVSRIQEAASNGGTYSVQLAARWLLRAHSDATTSAGAFVANAPLSELMDRSMGKPVAQVSVENHDTKTINVINLTRTALDSLHSKLGLEEDQEEIKRIDITTPPKRNT